jgi:bacillithiol system protein YtxJ
MVVELRRKQDFEQLLERSNEDAVLIFKHSTQCPISDAALEEFNAATQNLANTTCGLVLVIEHREVSNIIADVLKVRHQSPQAIVVAGGRSTWMASHWSITADALRDALSKG